MAATFKRVILFSVLAALLGVGIVYGLSYEFKPANSAQQESSSSATGLNNSVTFAGPITFEFVGSNSTEATAAAGSTVQGAIKIDILQAAPLRFYIDDREYNASGSTLPAGVSISLNVYGNSYYPLMLSNPQSWSTAPLVPTTLGETSVQYAISVASSVSKGVYDVRIVCLSWLNNGTLSDQGEVYDVTLHVQ